MGNRFRKKAVEVEAVQWTGENREEVRDFVGDGFALRFGALTAVTWEGEAVPGDYFVRAVGAHGHTICKRRYFEATYEPANQAQERGAAQVFADSVERDRREPDKILCHLQTFRRALGQGQEQGELEGQEFTITRCKVCGEQMRSYDHGLLGCACKGWGEVEHPTLGIFNAERHEILAVVPASSQPVLDVDGEGSTPQEKLDDLRLEVLAFLNGMHPNKCLAEKKLRAALSDLEGRDGGGGSDV